MLVGFWMNSTVFDQVMDFFHYVLPMGQQYEKSQSRGGSDGDVILGVVHANERQANKGEEAGQNGFAEKGKGNEEKKHERHREMVVVNEHGAQRGCDALSSAEP